MPKRIHGVPKLAIALCLTLAFALAACSPPSEAPKPQVAKPKPAAVAANPKPPQAKNVAEAQPPAPPVQASAQPGPEAPTRELPDIAPLVERLGPSVVNVSIAKTLHKRDAGGDESEFPEDDPLFDFFRRFAPPEVPREFESRSLGSGFILSEDGYVLTNRHVVEDADEVVVKLTDGREFQAKAIGSDPLTDVALLKIEAKGLPKVSIGDPARLRVGEWVIAIGAPFGFENSVTKGIVSAKGRSLPSENYVPFIQTDAAINPGNSGGPLFNLAGEVVGINSQIYSRTGGYMGLSFAIPIDIAMNVGEQLRTQGKVTRGRLGVQIQELTPDLAQSFGLERPRGALVSSVDKGSPAEKAGIVAGDVLLAFGGKTIQRSTDLPPLVAATKPGTSILVQVWRKGAAQEITVAVGELTAARSARRGESAPRDASGLGLVLTELTQAERERLKLDQGVRVRSARGAAARAGVRPGDIILSVNNEDVQNVEQFNSVVRTLPRKRMVALLVQRGSRTLYIPVRPDSR
jgi:serine protease Do